MGLTRRNHALPGLYTHGDVRHAHGVTFPDFPACHCAADSWDQLPAAIQEAAEAHFAGEEGPVPMPTPLEKLVSDPAYQGEGWMLAEIDITRVRSRPVRLNISLPERLAHQIDEAAKARHLTRSGFLAPDFVAQAALKEMARP
jgi:predicted RNase H-like HicB family nuclease